MTFKKINLNGEDVAFDPSSFVHHVFDRNSDFAKSSGQLGDAARTVADGDRELDQATVGGQAAFEAAAKDGGVDVAAAQQDDDAKRFLC